MSAYLYMRRALPALAIAGITAIVISACTQPSAKEASPAAGGPPVSVAAVLEKPITETQEFSGRLEAVDQADIRARVSGFIVAVHFAPGSEVKKGELLFTIDPRPYQAEVNRTEAAALAARAKADLAKTELARAEKLVVEKAISQREADEKVSSFKELDAYARAAQAAYQAAKLNLDFTQVRSPISGRVSKAEITVGNLVDPSALLTSVVSSNPVHASFDGDEDAFLRTRAMARNGKPATVRVGLSNESGFLHEGELEFVDNRVNTATGSVRMRALLKNPDNSLAPGLFARIQLVAGNSSGASSKAALITDRAVGTDQNRKFVYVVNDAGKAEYRQVKLGPVIDGLRVVREGVQPGEKIVVNGLQRVRPGAPVTAQLVAMTGDAEQPATEKANSEKPTKGDQSAAKPAATVVASK